jgi:tetratricopeptide (TPR) repeat protein
MICLCRAAYQLTLGGHPAAPGRVRQIEELAGRCGDPGPGHLAAAQFHSMRYLHLDYSEDDTHGALVEAQAAARHFEMAGDRRQASREWTTVAEYLATLGALSEAEERARCSLELADRLGLDQPRAYAAFTLGYCLAWQGQPRLAEAQQLLGAAAERYRAMGNVRLEGLALSHLAHALAAGGQLVEAAVRARRAVALLDGRYHENVARGALARVLLAQQRTSEALAEANQAVAQLEAGGAGECGAAVRLVQAEALAACHQHQAARTAISRSRELLEAQSRRIGDPSYRISFLALPDHVRTLELASRW